MTRPLCLLLLAAGATAGAESTTSFALFALAIGLALLVAGAALAVALAALRARVKRTVIEREVQEHDPVRLRFEVHGIKWLPVVVDAESGSGEWVELGPADALIELRVGRRGAYRLMPSQLRVRDAFGLFRWPLRAGAVEPLLILPSPNVPANVHTSYPTASRDPEPDGLQAHTPGTPLGRIHWPALARGAGLQVRRFAPAPHGLPLVVVDTAGIRDSHAVDWAARAAAGHILALARGGGCRVLLPGDTSAVAVMELDVSWPALHRRLATLDGERWAPSRLAGERPTVHVRASAAPPRSVRERARELPAGVVPVADGRQGLAV